MVNIGVCGVYGEGEAFSGGQPVKVKTTIRMFAEFIGDKNVFAVNTYDWRKHIFRLLGDILSISKKCDIIVILPAHNGIKIFAPLFLLMRKMFHFKLVYSVIGGWLPEYTKGSKKLRKLIKKIDYIFVETSWMQSELLKQGINNSFIVNNAKYLSPTNQIKEVGDTLKLCYFSRVMKQKGIEDAISAVVQLNNKYGFIAFSLDIYGAIDIGYKDEFEKVMCSIPKYISYNGCASPSESVKVLENYDLQIFPTRFTTEGIPGSIIDSYAAGVPIISSRWKSFRDVIVEGVTGFGYEQNNIDDLIKCLSTVYDNRNTIKDMSRECIKMYLDKYTPKSVFSEIEGIIQWH